MDGFIDFLINWGDWGMFVTAILGAAYFPICSEVVLVALLAVGVSPWELFVFASLGNIIGGVISYFLGYVVNREWMERVLHVRPEKMERAARLAYNHGALAAFFGWLPMLGSVLLTTLGMMRSNVPVTFISMSAGKIIRYLIIILPYLGLTMLIR